MNDRTKHIAKSNRGASTWEPYPLAEETIVAGKPNAKVHWLRATGEGAAAYYAGLWSVEPCTFDYVFAMNEAAHVIEGHVVITQKGGPTIELRAGDVASFPKGAETRWEVRERLTKFFVDTP